MGDLFSQIDPRWPRLMAGVDEAGRGPLAGDVVAGAVILDPEQAIAGLNDSKKLSEKRREQLFDEIRQKALCWSIGRASVEEIDRINILQASMLAMQRAVEGLTMAPELVLVDGNRCPVWLYHSEAIVKGDSKVAAIAAASIMAKVTRDREMRQLDLLHPEYGFAAHKGYPTARHLAALKTCGVLPQHRRSYGPVANILVE
ncbi:MAG: ribonuclease HII [Pseudomonadales bacterium]